MPEAWKDIPGFEGIYQISSKGNLRSLDRIVFNKGSCKRCHIKGKQLKPRKDRDGYLITELWKSNQSTTVKIHRLVAKAYVPGEASTVDHINGIRDDNRAENLRWLNSRLNNSNRHACQGASGIVGVCRTTNKTNPWQAYGKVNGKFKSIGNFPTKEQAAKARQEHLKEIMNA